MGRIPDAERLRIAELLAEGAPAWRLHQEINRSRYAIRRAVVALHRPPKHEPRRSPLRLSLAEREEVSRGLAAGEPVRAIARRLGRAPSTVCREVAANGSRDRYRACAADRRAVQLLRRPQAGQAGGCPRLREIVESKLELRWSPQQIAARQPVFADQFCAVAVGQCPGDEGPGLVAASTRQRTSNTRRPGLRRIANTRTSNELTEPS